LSEAPVADEDGSAAAYAELTEDAETGRRRPAL